jgi:hypothetical protein
MSSHIPALSHLAERVHGGDPSALPVLRHELETHMTRIVRRALRAEAAGGPLARRVRTEAEKLYREQRCAPDSQALAGQIASGLCTAVVSRLRAGAASYREAGDTRRG